MRQNNQLPTVATNKTTQQQDGSKKITRQTNNTYEKQDDNYCTPLTKSPTTKQTETPNKTQSATNADNRIAPGMVQEYQPLKNRDNNTIQSIQVYDAYDNSETNALCERLTNEFIKSLPADLEHSKSWFSSFWRQNNKSYHAKINQLCSDAIIKWKNCGLDTHHIDELITKVSLHSEVAAESLRKNAVESYFDAIESYEELNQTVPNTQSKRDSTRPTC